MIQRQLSTPLNIMVRNAVEQRASNPEEPLQETYQRILTEYRTQLDGAGDILDILDVMTLNLQIYFENRIDYD